MRALTLSLFGRFQAMLKDEPLSGFRTAKVQALLVYLAAEPSTPHRRETLMTLLWPGMPERSARQNLRQIIYNLHRAVSDLPLKADTDNSKEETAVPKPYKNGAASIAMKDFLLDTHPIFTRWKLYFRSKPLRCQHAAAPT